MNSYVMITGAAGGLGKARAAECVERGHPLFLTDLDPGRLEAFGAGLERLVDVVWRPCDLTDERAVDALWSWIGSNGFVFDGLLNVAAVGGDGIFDGLDVGWVAKRVYERSLDGRAVYIPGRLNVLLKALSKVIPERTKARLLGHRWERAAELMRN